MLCVIVTAQVKPEHREEFLAAILEDARDSLAKEPGCLRFDVIEDNADPNKFYFYEVYKDQAANDYHRTMPHYEKFRDSTEPWYSAPRTAIRGHNIFPTDEKWPAK
jgi:autoinducer 2-degrading protein